MEIKEASSLPSQTKAQLNQFVDKCLLSTGSKPQYVIIAPGRVNLIGDHVDYHGFSVLPMAIEQATWLGCYFQADLLDPKLTLINANKDKYPSWTGPHTLAYGASLDSSHAWYHYVLCAYHGLLATNLLGIKADQVYSHAKTLVMDHNKLELENKLLDKLPSMTLFIDSDLPEASGLSSSSALVCGSVVAVALLLQHQSSSNKSSICPIKLANMCSKFEHLIGTQGGGMDQAIIMNAQKNYAKYISFQPSLSFCNVRLPAYTDWVIAHCGRNYPKAATFGYNARVLETKLAAAYITKARQDLNIELDSTITICKVRDLLFNGETQNILQYIRNSVFKNKSIYSIDEICTFLELTESELNKKFNTYTQFTRVQMENKLNLLHRCEHVLEEAERVELFKSICDTTEDVTKLGQLMTESHYSLRDKYNCSHKALDKLVEVGLGAGALGCRLTGAGWGGCVVTLVDSSKSESVLHKLREVSKFCFKTSPQIGCQIIKI